jgi:ribonuclease D
MLGARVLTTTEELAEFAERALRSPAIGIDTEFMRERTYYARLCLIQCSLADETVIIDPFAVEDLSPLFDVLRDPHVLKVFHAGTQDLEIFYQLMGTTAAPVFDTQLAANLAGFPQQTGYGALVKELIGVQLDKADTFTDWARRPLTSAQTDYAHDDVRYLLPIHDKLMESLARDERIGWLEKDFARLANPAFFAVVPEEQWRRVKRVSSLNRRQLGVAREVAAWREREAQERDMPKRWVLSDESVIEIARRMPVSEDDLDAIRGVKDKLPRRRFGGVLKAVAAGRAIPDDALPTLERRGRRPAQDTDAAVDLMVALVRKRAREHGVAMPILASRDDLERLASGDRSAHALLEGWRAEIVGDELLSLLEGRIGLALKDGVLEIEER